jgi:hypothetical protein
MAHWLLRGRMAEHQDDGRARQERTEKKQCRPGQDEGDEEAARGGRSVRSSEVGTTPDQARGRDDRVDREAREGADDVPRRDSSAE